MGELNHSNMDSTDAEVVSLTSLHSTPAVQQAEQAQPRDETDRGYAWVIMLSAFATMLLSVILSWISTLLYQALLVRFQLSATTAGWIVSLPYAIRFLSSPFVTYLADKFSYKSVAMAGGITFSMGLLIYAFAPAVWLLYVGSVLLGAGSNMAIMSSMVMIPIYFSRKRAMAMSFALCGSSVGAMIYPPLVARSFSHFGYTQTLIFAACVTMQILVTSSLYRARATKKNSLSTDDRKSKCQIFKEISGVSLLRRPVLVHLMFVIASLHWMLTVIAVFISGLGIETANLSTKDIATTLAIAAFSDFCKLPVGFCFDHPKIRPYRMYLFCVSCIAVGVLSVLLTFTTDMLSFTLCYTIVNAFAMSAHSQYITMLGDVVLLESLPRAIAVTRTVIGITLLFVSTGIGRIKDLWDSFKYGFMLLSVTHVCIVTSYAIVYFCWKRHKDNSSKKSDA